MDKAEQEEILRWMDEKHPGCWVLLQCLMIVERGDRPLPSDAKTVLEIIATYDEMEEKCERFKAKD
jgi:hypothetical protein